MKTRKWKKLPLKTKTSYNRKSMFSKYVNVLTFIIRIYAVLSQ